MPRPRYPSDEKRARPYARVHLTTRNHPTYGHVFADPELRGMVYGLWQVARGAYAGDTDDTVTLSQGDVDWITGRTGRHARKALERVCTKMAYSLRVLDEHGDVFDAHTRSTRTRVRRVHYTVHVRNLQRKQGGGSAASRSKSKKKIQDEEEESSLTSPATQAPTNEARGFAGSFRESLKGRDPDAKLPSEQAFAGWVKSADRMFRIDGRDPDEAVAIATWLFNDGGPDAAFWRGNVRAVPKFRKQYETLREHKARAETKEKTDGGRGKGTVVDAAAHIHEVIRRRKGR